MYDLKERIPKNELDNRIRKFQKHLVEKNIDGALIMQNTDLYYFTGTIQQAHLYIPCQGSPLLMAKKNFERAKHESLIENIVAFTSPKQISNILKKEGYNLPNSIGMELDVLPANTYIGYGKIFEKCKLVDISHFIRLVRSVKSDYELGIMRQAAIFADKMIAHAGKLIKEGMSELDLASEVESYARKSGHQGNVRMRLWGNEMFYGHIMTGDSAAVPSFLASPTGGIGASPATAQGAGFNKIKQNEPVIVDYVFAYRGYLADETRIFAINGLPDELVSAHEAMLDIDYMIREKAKPGVSSGDLYDIAVTKAEQLGYEDNFMGAGSDRVRFIGHGLGLELDEYPFIAQGQNMLLKKNMTIAMEPKAIFPGKGAVGIENTFVVTENGLEPLTTLKEKIDVIAPR